MLTITDLKDTHEYCHRSETDRDKDGAVPHRASDGSPSFAILRFRRKKTK
jgi:hypothetical protein